MLLVCWFLTTLNTFAMLHWIEKQSGSGRALEHLEFPGSKVLMNGPPQCKLCMRGNRERSLNKKMKFLSTLMLFGG